MIKKPLTEEKIDEIVIGQIDDDDAWEPEISVMPVSRPRVATGDESQVKGNRPITPRTSPR